MYKFRNSVCFLLVRGAWEQHLRDCVSVIPERFVMVVEVIFVGEITQCWVSTANVTGIKLILPFLKLEQNELININ